MASTSRRPGAQSSPDDLLDADLHVGHNGPPEGRAAHARNLVAGIGRLRPGDQLPDDGRVVSWLPMAHIAERVLALPADVRRLLDDLLPGPAPGGRLPARGAAQLVLRGPAHLGEAQGRDRGRHRGRAGRGEEAGDPVGARRGPRRCAPSRRARRSARSSPRSTPRPTSSCCRRSARGWGSTRSSR